MIKYTLSKSAKILFVGINPHYGSYRRGIPFSNNKMFWYLLNRAGLIKENMEDLRSDKGLMHIYKEKFARVYNLNFTNVIERPSRNVSQLRRGEEIAGRRRVLHIIYANRPRVVCFIGRIAYAKFIGSDEFDFGRQKSIHGSKVYVIHFPLRGRAVVRVRELKLMARVAAYAKD